MGVFYCNKTNEILCTTFYITIPPTLCATSLYTREAFIFSISNLVSPSRSTLLQTTFQQYSVLLPTLTNNKFILVPPLAPPSQTTNLSLFRPLALNCTQPQNMSAPNPSSSSSSSSSSSFQLTNIHKKTAPLRKGAASTLAGGLSYYTMIYYIFLVFKRLPY